MIEARHLRVLRAVAASGSFSAAARELGCTQPAVSQQMKSLEQSVGTPLLVRGGRETRLAEGARVGIGELAGEPWIAGCPRCRGHLVEVCEAAGFTPRIDFATDDYPAVVGLVGAGLGVAVLPELAVRSVRTQGARTVRVTPEVRREVVALTLPDLARVPAVEAMLDRLAAAGRR